MRQLHRGGVGVAHPCGATRTRRRPRGYVPPAPVPTLASRVRAAPRDSARLHLLRAPPYVARGPSRGAPPMDTPQWARAQSMVLASATRTTLPPPRRVTAPRECWLSMSEASVADRLRLPTTRTHPHPLLTQRSCTRRAPPRDSTASTARAPARRASCPTARASATRWRGTRHS